MGQIPTTHRVHMGIPVIQLTHTTMAPVITRSLCAVLTMTHSVKNAIYFNLLILFKSLFILMY